jgi:hypothetical protein
MTAFLPQNLVQVDDRKGNHYWIFELNHVTGTDSTVNVDNSCISASLIGTAATTAGTCTVADTDSSNDYSKEVTVDSGEATGLKTVIARFTGSAAGSSSSKIDA